MPAKRALLIGIQAYPHVPSLNGCVNDVHLMRSVLIENFGFPESQITLLANEQATRAGILSAFDTLVSSTTPNDIIVVHYAGHGSQVADREGDEPSGFDSTIVPFDATRPAGDPLDITDDEIHLRIEALAQKTPFITLIFDACHSGTITRDDFGESPRSIDADTRPASELPPSPIPAARQQALRTIGPSGWLPLTDTYVLIAGCRDDEKSYEYRPAEGGGRVVHGALTYFLCQQLRRMPETTTWRDVFERTAVLVNAANNLQHPQMEGRADREVFGVTDFVPATFVRILEREDDAVLLGAGAAHGVTAGSTYGVFAQGTKDPKTGVAIGEVVVAEVQSVTALARITREEPAGGIVPEARAFEQTHAFRDRRLTLLSIENPDAFSRLRGRFSVVLEKLSADMKTWVEPAPASTSPGTAPIAPAIVASSEPPIAPTPASPADGGGLIVFDEGDIIRILIRSRHDAPVFVSLFDIGLSGEIAQIYPPRGAQEMLRANGELACPAQRLGFPADYPSVDGIESVKLFVTEQATDFSAFAQHDIRGGVRGGIAPPSPLAALLSSAIHGHATTRDSAPEPPAVPLGDEDWTTAAASFVLRRRVKET